MCGVFFIGGSNKSKSEIEKAFNSFAYRGPDNHQLNEISDNGYIGFHRLSIMDLSDNGNQPFKIDSSQLICNGEIYNFEQLKSKFSFNYSSNSDCEVILPMIKEIGIKDTAISLDGEFAFIYFNQSSGEIFAARDAIGIRPLFYGYSDSGSICFASEAKGLLGICEEINPFPPGHFFENGMFHKFIDFRETLAKDSFDLDLELKGIRDLLISGVKKRLTSDAPIGFLLSGGLDSSLVCAIAAKHSNKPIETFSIGINDSAIDNKYAKIVSDHIGSNHHEVIFTKEDIFKCLDDLIFYLESWDITTIRASVGMYLVCKYIKEKTDLKVVLTGEVSDEIFGYKYTDYAPSPDQFQEEAYKRVEELYLFDVLRADRCISSNSLEARVPFSDTDFVKHVFSINASKKMNIWGQGKYLLRKAFDDGSYLPPEILYREKAAFSDAVGHTCVEYIKRHAAVMYSDDENYVKLCNKYSHNKPFTKESLMYREIFHKHFPNHQELIKEYWMPNKNWENCDVKDPSARVLPNYGESAN